MLSNVDKKYITRYIYLNQPCSFSNLLNDFCKNEYSPILLEVNDVVKYIVKIYKEKHIIFKPHLKEIETLLKFHTINSLLEKKIVLDIIIPNYISKVWKNWYIKNYLKTN